MPETDKILLAFFRSLKEYRDNVGENPLEEDSRGEVFYVNAFINSLEYKDLCEK